MTYPNNPQFLAWWNLGAHDRQSRVKPDGSNLDSGYSSTTPVSGYDPTADSVLQDLSPKVTPNYAPGPAPLPTQLQSGPTPFDSDDT